MKKILILSLILVGCSDNINPFFVSDCGNLIKCVGGEGRVTGDPKNYKCEVTVNSMSYEFKSVEQPLVACEMSKGLGFYSTESLKTRKAMDSCVKNKEKNGFTPDTSRAYCRDVILRGAKE